VTAPLTPVVQSEGKIFANPWYLVDVTEQGIGIKASIALTSGEIVIIVSREGSIYAVNIRVIWASKARSDEEGELGLEFQNPVPTTRSPRFLSVGAFTS